MNELLDEIVAEMEELNATEIETSFTFKGEYTVAITIEKIKEKND